MPQHALCQAADGTLQCVEVATGTLLEQYSTAGAGGGANSGGGTPSGRVFAVSSHGFFACSQYPEKALLFVWKSSAALAGGTTPTRAGASRFQLGAGTRTGGGTQKGIKNASQAQAAASSSSAQHDFDRSVKTATSHQSLKTKVLNPVYRASLPEKISALVFTSCSQYLLAGSDTGKVYVWHIDSGNLVNCFCGAHYSAVTSLALSVDDQVLLSGSKDGSVAAWRNLYFGGGSMGASGAGGGGSGAAGAKMTTNLMRKWTGHTLGVTQVLFSEDTRLVISASLDHSVRICELFSGREVRSVQCGGQVRCLALGNLGCLYVGGAGFLKTLNVNGEHGAATAGDQHETRSFRLEADSSSAASTATTTGSATSGPILRLALSYDRCQLLSSDGRFVHVWCARTAQKVKTFKNGAISLVGLLHCRRIGEGAAEDTGLMWRPLQRAVVAAGAAGAGVAQRSLATGASTSSGGLLATASARAAQLAQLYRTQKLSLDREEPDSLHRGPRTCSSSSALGLVPTTSNKRSRGTIVGESDEDEAERSRDNFRQQQLAAARKALSVYGNAEANGALSQLQHIPVNTETDTTSSCALLHGSSKRSEFAPFLLQVEKQCRTQARLLKSLRECERWRTVAKALYEERAAMGLLTGRGGGGFGLGAAGSGAGNSGNGKSGPETGTRASPDGDQKSGPDNTAQEEADDSRLTASILAHGGVSSREHVAQLKEQFPKEWAIFRNLDQNLKGFLTQEDVDQMCEAIQVPEMSEFLFDVLDRNGDGKIDFGEVVANYKIITMVRNAARFRSWKRTFGLGVAGNVAGHMDQAGEADPTSSALSGGKGPELPAAVFAFYVPPPVAGKGKYTTGLFGKLFGGGADADKASADERTTPETTTPSSEMTDVERSTTSTNHGRGLLQRLDSRESFEQKISRLRRFPISNAIIHHPGHLDGVAKVQVEPEIALFVDVVYEDLKTRNNALLPVKKLIKELKPVKIAAFNDCSVRSLEGSVKLSEKKNWGRASKGISMNYFPIDSLEEVDPKTGKKGLASRLWIGSWLLRKGDLHEYTVRAPARSYLLFYQPLLNWIINRCNCQGDEAKWEDIGALLHASNYPENMWIALGAGQYTAWGEENFVELYDETVVIIWDEAVFGKDGPSEEIIKNSIINDEKSPQGLLRLVCGDIVRIWLQDEKRKSPKSPGVLGRVVDFVDDDPAALVAGKDSSGLKVRLLKDPGAKAVSPMKTIPTPFGGFRGEDHDQQCHHENLDNRTVVRSLDHWYTNAGEDEKNLRPLLFDYSGQFVHTAAQQHVVELAYRDPLLRLTDFDFDVATLGRRNAAKQFLLGKQQEIWGRFLRTEGGAPALRLPGRSRDGSAGAGVPAGSASVSRSILQPPPLEDVARSASASPSDESSGKLATVSLLLGLDLPARFATFPDFADFCRRKMVPFSLEELTHLRLLFEADRQWVFSVFLMDLSKMGLQTTTDARLLRHPANSSNHASYTATLLPVRNCALCVARPGGYSIALEGEQGGLPLRATRGAQEGESLEEEQAAPASGSGAESEPFPSSGRKRKLPAEPTSIFHDGNNWVPDEETLLKRRRKLEPQPQPRNNDGEEDVQLLAKEYVDLEHCCSEIARAKTALCRARDEILERSLVDDGAGRFVKDWLQQVLLVRLRKIFENSHEILAARTCAEKMSRKTTTLVDRLCDEAFCFSDRDQFGTRDVDHASAGLAFLQPRLSVIRGTLQSEVMLPETMC
eukprot:g11883.t1